MFVDYHSEKFITDITLMINEKTSLKMAGISSEQIKKGASRGARNNERKVFFLYSAMVASACTAIIVPLSAFLLILYLSFIGPNLGSVLCMPFWITIFITKSLNQKARYCHQDKILISFSRNDVLSSLLKAGFVGVSLVSLILWIIS